MPRLRFNRSDSYRQDFRVERGLHRSATASFPETKTKKWWWAEVIRRDLVAGTTAFISAGRKFIEAKQALKETNEYFTDLVTDLGYDLDTVERWMAIARHPVLSDSENFRNLPTAWTTLHTLSRIPQELLLKYIADGIVHAQLSGKAATQLLKCGGANGGRNPNGSDDAGRDHEKIAMAMLTATIMSVAMAGTISAPISKKSATRTLPKMLQPPTPRSARTARARSSASWPGSKNSSTRLVTRRSGSPDMRVK